MILRVAAAVGLIFALGASTASPGRLSAELQAAQKIYVAHASAIAALTGPDNVPDYYGRLFDDVSLLNAPAPRGYDAAGWAVTVSNVATLDLDLIAQLQGDNVRPMRTIRGAGETLVRSSKDGTLQPVGVYVPSGYRATKPSALIVFLHGRLQSESELLAPAYVQALAERNDAIVIAPYGRGHYDFKGAYDDIYDALDAAQKAFAIDPRRTYLAGYSMGAFSVFGVAPVRPSAWAAVMCVAGGMLFADARGVTSKMHGTPFYVLTGTDDQSIPTKYPTLTAQYLMQHGIAVSFYSQPGGIHRLITLLPILQRAWGDMLHGVVRSPPPSPSGPVQLPIATPPQPKKP